MREEDSTSSPDDYLALSPLFIIFELLIPFGAEFNALSPHKHMTNCCCLCLKINATFILLYFPKSHFCTTSLLFCSNSTDQWQVFVKRDGAK